MGPPAMNERLIEGRVSLSDHFGHLLVCGASSSNHNPKKQKLNRRWHASMFEGPM
jgi:hypothetical protein